METKNKFLILLITITSIVFCASGEFTGWGDKILHHVADSDPQSIYTINSEKFVDTNNNDKWDTGNYLKKIQPEEVIYYPFELELRANWDLNETFNATQKYLDLLKTQTSSDTLEVTDDQ